MNIDEPYSRWPKWIEEGVLSSWQYITNNHFPRHPWNILFFKVKLIMISSHFSNNCYKLNRLTPLIFESDNVVFTFINPATFTVCHLSLNWCPYFASLVLSPWTPLTLNINKLRQMYWCHQISILSYLLIYDCITDYVDAMCCQCCGHWLITTFKNTHPNGWHITASLFHSRSTSKQVSSTIFKTPSLARPCHNASTHWKCSRSIMVSTSWSEEKEDDQGWTGRMLRC